MYVLQTLINFRNFRWNTRTLSSSLCCLAKLFFRTLNRFRTDLCETLNKILSSLWPFKLFAICSQTRPRSGLTLFCEYGWNSKFFFNRIRSWSLVQRIATAGLRNQDKKRWLNVTLKKNSHLARSDTKQFLLIYMVLGFSRNKTFGHDKLHFSLGT